MTKQELERAIENGESVWCLFKDIDNGVDIVEINLSSVDADIKDNDLMLFSKDTNTMIVAYNVNTTYKSKAEAEHYLHHANITRTETLPFLTWEEFKNINILRFIGKNGEKCKLEGYDNLPIGGFIDVVVNGTGLNNYYEYTEEDFYKAYDECVRLFKGE